ncbi:nuclear transport factor 2 family protein [Mesorhizobium sp. VK9D]|uniref:nuclear transport factor 2 family protein n=1 Tax=Mesorhizobium australafricanum TaxID=3072311 RepID=UPI002A23C02F|nr:nuclear transport factor 2 family protein [Mesorhizobium sp. VK9D]MDX8452312.1 nuclear transport factor 2 family protein [Mesorhizobium sp. VK9D]
MALFSEDAVYERADARYVGRAAIEHFYRNERMIRGTHTLDRTCHQEDAARVFVTGQFKGHGANEAPRLVRFTDIWEFDEQNKVRRRETYLALGQTYVER